MSSECEHEREKKIKITLTKFKLLGESRGRKHPTCESAPPVGCPYLFLCSPCPSGQQCGLCLQVSLGSNQELFLHAFFLLTQHCFQAILESSCAACPFKASFLSSHFCSIISGHCPFFLSLISPTYKPKQKITLITNNMYIV